MIQKLNFIGLGTFLFFSLIKVASFFSESHENSREEENSRDFMLRKDDNPGYLRPDNSKERHDVELDHLPEDFGKFHAPGPSHIETQPDSRHNNHQGFTKTFNFGQSFSSSSVRLQG